MRIKITRFFSVFLLTGVLFSEASTLHAQAFMAGKCSHGYWHATAYETTNTTYPHADDNGHQRATEYVFICKVCEQGWSEVLYFNEPHVTPDNNPCVCGFVPHH